MVTFCLITQAFYRKRADIYESPLASDACRRSGTEALLYSGVFLFYNPVYKIRVIYNYIQSEDTVEIQKR